MNKSAKKITAIISCLGFLALIYFVFTCFAIKEKSGHMAEKTNEKIDHRKHIDFDVNKFKNKDAITSIEAEMHGEKYAFGYPTTRKFVVSRSYHKEICDLFSGKHYPYAVENEQIERKSQWGSLYITFSNVEKIQIDFFMSGKGCLEYSVGDDFFVMETGDTDGGIALLMLLNEAYKSAKAE